MSKFLLTPKFPTTIKSFSIIELPFTVKFLSIKTFDLNVAFLETESSPQIEK